jgi:parallel beta-helix repeat protein
LTIRSDDVTASANHFHSSEGDVDIQGSGNRFVHNTSTQVENSPLALREADHTRVEGNVFESLFEGITLDASDDNVIRNNTARSYASSFGARGLEFRASNGNLVQGNTFVDKSPAVWVLSGTDNAFKNNTAITTTNLSAFPELDGFRVEQAAVGTVLWRNTASGSRDDGFDVEAVGTQLKGNTADSNGDLGIEAVSGVIDLGGNRASGNGNPLQCLNVVCR